MTTTSPSQIAAEFLWALATSDSAQYARSDFAPYQSAKAAFLATLKAEYGLTDPREAEYVYNIYCELGPNDAHQDARTGLRGIRSYVDAMRSEMKDEARSDFTDAVTEVIANALRDCPGLTEDELRADFEGALTIQTGSNTDCYR